MIYIPTRYMTTTWTTRTPVYTDWVGRRRPITFMTPLQDAYRKVHDQDNKVIYILANSGKEIPATFWSVRPKV